MKPVDEVLDAPIVVLGAPRSGTTILAALLDAHPDVVGVGEQRLLWRHGNDRRSDELLPEHATPAIVARIRGNLARMVEEAGGSRLVEKTPSNSLRPWFVERVLPEARYVHITRDGFGAVPAMRAFWDRRAQGFDAKQRRKLGRRVRETTWRQAPYYAAELVRRLPLWPSRHVQLYGPRLAGLQQLVDERGRLVASAAIWRTCVERAATFGRRIGPDRYLQLALEDVDEDALRRVLAFSGLSEDERVIDEFRRTFSVEAARNQAPISDEERHQIEPFVLPVNAFLGYPAAIGESDRAPLRPG